MPRLLRYGLYPVILGFTLSYLWLELSGPMDTLGRYYGYYLAALVTAMVVIEALHPMRRVWGMTAASFFSRDLPYLGIAAATLVLAGSAAQWALGHAGVQRATWLEG